MRKSHKIKDLATMAPLTPPPTEAEAEAPLTDVEVRAKLQSEHRQLHKLPEISANQTEGGFLVTAQADRARTWMQNYFQAREDVRRITPGLFALTVVQFAEFCRAIPKDFMLGVQAIQRAEVHSSGRLVAGAALREATGR